MNYPVWYLPEVGGGFLIALIAILHVFVSHFAVGGGLYLIYSEKKGLRENNQGILDFTKMHARFFLLVTMVFGSITGVGIWFIIALVNPGATSVLIHNFVFGWAAEWVFFVVEIVAAFVYFYTFGKMDNSTHLKVGWVYFIAAWMSLFLINGIIGVMLTPGGWVDSMNFWAGFFNPSFWPALFFRTFIALMIAASYGFLSAASSKDHTVRATMTRFSAKWALASLVAAIPFAFWYVAVLPESSQALVLGKSPTIALVLPWGLIGIVLFFLVALFAGVWRPNLNMKPVAIVSMVAALMILGGFEWVREAARRPYVLNDLMYSNGVLKSQEELLNSGGFIKHAIWTENVAIDETNIQEVGKELFINQCYACHTLGGGNNDIIPATMNMSFRALKSYLAKIHDIRYFMPPFFGTEQERVALAAYIVGGIHGKPVETMPSDTPAAPPGQLLFEEHCSSCHSIEEVQGAFADSSDEEGVTLLRTLDSISDEMEPFAGTDEEAGQLATYLAAPQTVALPVPGSITTGDLVFEENCSSCHEISSLRESLAGTDQQELLKTLATLNEISDEMQPFTGTAEEAELLSQYLLSADEETGQPQVEEGFEVFKKHCGVCHAPQDVAEKLADKNRVVIFDILGRLDQLQKTMPPFKGSMPEREALTDYVLSASKGGK